MILSSWADQAYWDRERKEAEWLASRPICDECGEPIQDDYLFKIGSFQYCPECIEGFREQIND